MNTTQLLVNAAMQAQGLTTYYQLAKRLETSHQRVAKWVRGYADCDNNAAAELAMIAGMHPGSAVLMIAASKSKSESTRAALLKAAEMLKN